MVHVASSAHECLLRRPEEEDHRSPPAGHDQDRGRPRFSPTRQRADHRLLRQKRRTGEEGYRLPAARSLRGAWKGTKPINHEEEVSIVSLRLTRRSWRAFAGNGFYARRRRKGD